ncbi:MAG: response regulator, partial [Spirochaetota bacterium]
MSSVLVVDDEKYIRETLRDVLEDEGYSVLTAGDGKNALDILNVNMVDIVLLDLWLPEMGGLEVLGRIKEEYSEVQIIIITGHGTIDSAVKA